ncbi:hypothetical protein Enr13x_34770 [Stieleria neptunia]|uniref:Uncharacterized protein n=1 Tax=Stieleria neptunia TaxID=2527979 RepID=A0A518HRZ2_9BACT|nr:hypothetical protein [Stieleria neptunia]QDV43620.1 hypothetical protein Enr13x_34770 [Stieleria neptunia]
MGSEINPYAAPQSAPARPVPITVDFGQRRMRFAVGFAALLMIGSLLASAFAIYDIESIVVSGPLLSLFALVLAVLSIRSDLRGFWILSAATVAMSIGCFLTIFLGEWSPGDAQVPIGAASVVFAIVIQAGWVMVRSVWERGKGLGEGDSNPQ